MSRTSTVPALRDSTRLEDLPGSTGGATGARGRSRGRSRGTGSRSRSRGTTGSVMGSNGSGVAPLLISDVDGVAYPYVEMLRSVAVAHSMPGAASSAKHPRTYEMDGWMPQETLREAHLLLMSSIETHRSAVDVLNGSDPVSVYSKLLTDLHKHGARIMFATRRAHYSAQIGGNFDDAAEITRLWLAERYPFPHQVEFVQHKTDLDVFSDRSPLLIDDNPHEVRAVAEAGCCAWLMDQPYNRRWRQRRGLTRFRLDRLNHHTRLLDFLAAAAADMNR